MVTEVPHASRLREGSAACVPPAAKGCRGYITSITVLTPMLPQTLFCPVSHNMLEIMDICEIALYDFP